MLKDVDGKLQSNKSNTDEYALKRGVENIIDSYDTF